MCIFLVLSIRPHIYFPLQHSFFPDLRHFEGGVAGWFWHTIWRGYFLVKGSTFHLGDLLEEAALFLISDQTHFPDLYVVVDLQP